MDILDVYIIIFWELLEECFKNINNCCMFYFDGVFLELLAEGEWVYFIIVYNVDGLFIDSYCYFIGLDSIVDYILNLFIWGSGVMVCISIFILGLIILFQVLINLIVLIGVFFGEVIFSWINNFQLMSSVLVFCKIGIDSVLVEVILGIEIVDILFIFVDVYVIGNLDNLVNGQVYEYCLVIFND